MQGNGGSVLVSSGFSSDGSSGKTSIESSPSGPNGVSGDIFISSGASEAGSSGMIALQTGSSKYGAGGSLSLRIGDGGEYDGGDISLTAGQASSQARKGGSVSIMGGEGSSAHSTDGGDGGDIVLMGGEAKGEGNNDNAGSITIQGGTSFTGYGGSLELLSGQSTKSSSGDVCECCIAFCFTLYHHRSNSYSLPSFDNPTSFSLLAAVLASAPSGYEDGSSGSLTLSTGKAEGGHGSSGSIVVNTGDAIGGPAGGFSIELGETRETYDVGASIEFKTGHNPNTSSGAFRVQTADAGNRGNSGEISLRTGTAESGNSGSMLVETGSAVNGEGGEHIFSVHCSLSYHCFITAVFTFSL